ncbi:hypothetical protein, partial [Nocardia arizonensis]|uniref:hypothetical protein n=1 Tax=Nocardia arizonensis TaxID=1141647 RepID=UPI001951ABBE
STIESFRPLHEDEKGSAGRRQYTHNTLDNDSSARKHQGRAVPVPARLSTWHVDRCGGAENSGRVDQLVAGRVHG